MRRGKRIAAACVLAAAFSMASGRGASAGSNGAAEAHARYLLFANTDMWREGGFAHGGLLWAQQGLDRDGLVFKTMVGGGLYHYISGALGNADVRGGMLAASLLPGWRIVRDKLAATVFLGADFQRHRLTPDDPSAGLRGNYAGVKTGFELWYEPSPLSMLAADASLSSIGPSYNARLAYGWRMLDRFYVGPEVQGFAADDNYKQLRAGVHITGFRTGDYEWSAGFGWATDSDHNSGAYGKLGFFTRR